MNLSDFVKDDQGRLSSMRLLFLTWGLGTFVVWLVLSLKEHQLLALPISVTTFISSLIAGKIVQNYSERDININDGGK